MISSAFNKNCFKIVKMIALAPGSRFRRKDMQERTMLNNVPLDDALARLVSAAILKKEKNHYFLNLENEDAKRLIDIAKNEHLMMKEIPLKVQYLLLDIADECIGLDVEIILFGSYSKLTYREGSDVDIAILKKDGAGLKGLKEKVARLEEKYGLNVEIHDFDKDKFYRNRTDPLVKEILRDGIRLI